jgi:hypothetical protein
VAKKSSFAAARTGAAGCAATKRGRPISDQPRHGSAMLENDRRLVRPSIEHTVEAGNPLLKRDAASSDK